MWTESQTRDSSRCPKIKKFIGRVKFRQPRAGIVLARAARKARQETANLLPVPIEVI
jgi:hypothetical protein